MRVSDVRTLYDYNLWANDRILDTATALTAEQFTAPSRFPHGSLRGTLVHILRAERIWLSFWRGQPRPPFLSEEECHDATTLRERWRHENAQLGAYFATLTDADLDRSLTFIAASGRIRSTGPQWAFMLHLVNHGTQHRSEAAQMLTEFGHSPGDVDICWPFLRDEQGGDSPGSV